MSHVWCTQESWWCMNESCHSIVVYEWVMCGMPRSHVPHINESCHTYEWVMCGMPRSHVPHINESCHTYEWVMCGMPRSHGVKWRRHSGVRMSLDSKEYGVTTIRRLYNIIGLFCRIQSLWKGSFAKETCVFKEPTNRSHPTLNKWVVSGIRMSHGGVEKSHVAPGWCTKESCHTGVV